MAQSMLKTRIKDSIINIKREDLIANGQLHEWIAAGRPLPGPDALKQQVIKQYARRFKLDTLLETGTFLGRMVWATRHTFDRIYSVELDQALYEAAAMRFDHYQHISIYHGDSGEVLPRILPIIKTPTLFWLDGHFSGDMTAKGATATPIMKELEHILSHQVQNHVLLIDDARLFNGRDDYPTLDYIQAYVRSHRAEKMVQVKNDIIRIYG